MNISHVFPQNVLAAINFVGVGAGDGGARAKARCEWELLLCSVANTTLELEQKPWVGLKPAPSPTTVHSPQLWQPWFWWGTVPQSKRGWKGCLAWARACTEAVVGNQPESWAVSICFLSLVMRVSKNVCILHEQSLDFLQPCCQSYWFSNNLRALVLPLLDPRAGGPRMWFKPLPRDISTLVISPLFCVPS